MKISFNKDYIEYCEANKDEIIKIWQEEREPVIFKYNQVPIFDLIQLFEILEKYNFIHIDFTKIDKWCLDVSDKSDDIISAEAASKEEVILRVILEIRRNKNA